ncbi:ATP-binding protein, partial [Mycolicibacterium gadium]
MTDQILATSAADAEFVRVDNADALTVARMRRELSQWLRAHLTLDPDRLNDVLLAVNEALTNAAEFA